MKKSKKSEETVREEAVKATTVKKSVSFSQTVNGWAEEMAEKGGYDNFSAYIQHLIRQDRDRERQLAAAEKATEAALKEASDKIKP